MSDSASTFGTYAASELIAAKSAGRSFKKDDLANFLDVLLHDWMQRQPAIPCDSRPSASRTSIPPAPADVTAYFASIGYPISGEEFCDSYAQKGWVVGKAKMKDWQSACRNWKRNGWGKLPKGRTATTDQPRDYSSI